MIKTIFYNVYYDLGLFEDAKDVEKFLDSPLLFLTNKESDVHITTGLAHNKFVVCSPVWHEYVDGDKLQRYYSLAKEIYRPNFSDKDVARGYYESYLGALDDGDLYSLMEKEEDYAVFLAMYILMSRDGAILRG
jgi:hypothetical protein